MIPFSNSSFPRFFFFSLSPHSAIPPSPSHTSSHRVGHSVIPTSTPTAETLWRTSSVRSQPPARTQPATSALLPLKPSPVPPSSMPAISNPSRVRSITSPEITTRWPPVYGLWSPTIKTSSASLSTSNVTWPSRTA